METVKHQIVQCEVQFLIDPRVVDPIQESMRTAETTDLTFEGLEEVRLELLGEIPGADVQRPERRLGHAHRRTPHLAGKRGEQVAARLWNLIQNPGLRDFGSKLAIMSLLPLPVMTVASEPLIVPSSDSSVLWSSESSQSSVV